MLGRFDKVWYCMVNENETEVNMNKELERFYNANNEVLEQMWEEHVATGEWGSGSDRITITDDMFWEFVGEVLWEVEQGKRDKDLNLVA